MALVPTEAKKTVRAKAAILRDRIILYSKS
jgi:hypothetical protein